MDAIGLVAVVTAAVAPMLYATFSSNAAATSTAHRTFTFVWPFAVLFALPLVWSPEVMAEELFVAVCVILPAMAVCASVCIARRPRH